MSDKSKSISSNNEPAKSSEVKREGKVGAQMIGCWTAGEWSSSAAPSRARAYEAQSAKPRMTWLGR